MVVNAGAFMFAQSGVYLSDDQTSMMLPEWEDDGFKIQFFTAIFKGNKPHSRFAPVLQDPALRDAIILNRVGLVCYLSHKVMEQASSKMAVFC